ncbi:hypothetical protein OD350_16075 [Clostridium beijerinckii]|uniref:Uncharacterized protein n=1 Tax=Clostridium beijerinckii TaxID=1520 RepID=A0AAX0BBU2_CLOBE|nr:hypothetical protein [Clostridium beijerinckii]NRT91928.1 hypothetical protein [Clostridium beijerinckii]NYC71454.1 hypothetical protein [Clostridium beijerinckii]UYZ33778.1 hypothetical protein OD350_16075 [Clostridium beijerinckii]
MLQRLQKRKLSIILIASLILLSVTNVSAKTIVDSNQNQVVNSVTNSLSGVDINMKAAEAVVSTIGDANTFYNSIGVNTHFAYSDKPYWNYYVNVKDKLISLGVKHIRDGAELETSWKYKTIRDRYIDLNNNGIKSTLIVSNSKYDSNVTAANFKPFVDDVGNACEAVTGCNEPDLNWGTDWVNSSNAYQQSVWNTFNSYKTVLGFSIGHKTNITSSGNISAWCDYGDAHPYPGGSTPERGIDSWLSSLTSEYGNKKIIATETGYNAVVDAYSTSKYLPRLFAENFRRGVVRSYWYQFVDTDGWGLVDSNLNERQSYKAMKNLLCVVGTSTGSGSLNFYITEQPTNVRTFLLKQGTNKLLLFVYRDVAVGTASGTVSIKFNQSIKKINRYNPTYSADIQYTWTAPTSISFGVDDTLQILQIFN